MKRYLYNVETVPLSYKDAAIKAILCEHGSLGWELVTQYIKSEGNKPLIVFIFKREDENNIRDNPEYGGN